MTMATELPERRAARPMAVSPGSHDRLGATMTGDGVTFCVYARRATGLDLLLFGGVDDIVPTRVIHLDPRTDRTGDYWHVQVRGIEAGQLYGFAADGPWDSRRGAALRRDQAAAGSIRPGSRDADRLPPARIGRPRPTTRRP